MNLSKISVLGLQMRLGLARFGWVGSIACTLIVIGLLTWGLGIPLLKSDTRKQLNKLQQVQQSLSSAQSNPAQPARSELEDRLAAFYDILGDERYVEQQVKTMFAIARKSGLVLSQGEYKSVLDRNSHTTTYQVVLPVRGQYQVIRQFCEQTLLVIPFAALDEVNFKRDEISNNTLEAKLHFTLYLTDPKISTPPDLREPAASDMKGDRS